MPFSLLQIDDETFSHRVFQNEILLTYSVHVRLRYLDRLVVIPIYHDHDNVHATVLAKEPHVLLNLHIVKNHDVFAVSIDRFC